MRPARCVWMVASIWAATTITAVAGGPRLPNLLSYGDASGEVRTFSTGGGIDLRGLFFQSLGTNGRSCGTCHAPANGWTVTPDAIEARFDATGGLDPIFRTNDGSNSPLADVSTVAARRAAYNMLLTKGLIRVGIGLPDVRDFDLVAVDDPYGYASASQLSLFRRPLPSTNLLFLSTVMWDGRESFAGESLHFDLSDQANGATQGHAAGSPLSNAQREAIVAFETSLFTAQSVDADAGNLDAGGADGGPQSLAKFLGLSGSTDVFTPPPFTLFSAWSSDDGAGRFGDARASIARGEAIFNTRPITISGVNGVNDALGLPSFTGTCTTCHNTANVGNHATALPLDLGIASAARRTPDMPLYTFSHRGTGEIIQTTDPGRALITGFWKDMQKFKGPVLRGLASRAPYFHNGAAATLEDLVQFYDERFGLGLTAQEKADLVAFLRSL